MQSLGTEHHVRGESSALGQRHSRSWSEEVRSIVQARANKVVRQLDFGAHLDLVLFGDRLYACARAGCGLGSVRICRVLFKSCCAPRALLFRHSSVSASWPGAARCAYCSRFDDAPLAQLARDVQNSLGVHRARGRRAAYAGGRRADAPWLSLTGQRASCAF